MRSHTRSLHKPMNPQDRFDFLAVCPIISIDASLLVYDTDKQGKQSLNLAQSKVLVKGSVGRTYKVAVPEKEIKIGDPGRLNFNTRMVTLPGITALTAFKKAVEDGTVTSVNVQSWTSGNLAGDGTEPGFLLELVGSEEAIALAESLGLDPAFETVVGRDAIQVEHSNAIMITLDAVCTLEGVYQFPGIERAAAFTPRAKEQNPDMIAAIAVFDATGALPERQRVQRAGGYDESFSKSIVNPAAPRRGRATAQGNGPAINYGS